MTRLAYSATGLCSSQKVERPVWHSFWCITFDYGSDVGSVDRMALSCTDALTHFASRPYGSESSVCTVLFFGIVFLG